MKDFRDLKVWAKAHELALHVYRVTAQFPAEERYGMSAQMRRCAVSIPSNIAEGCGRGSDADFARFLQMAMGSACELEYQLLLAQDLGYLAEGQHVEIQPNLEEIKRMLAGLIRTVRERSANTKNTPED